MTNLTISLDETALREATMQAVMGILTPEHRDKLLKTAINELLIVETGSYGSKKSALQRAFEQAVETLAMKCAKELVETDTALKAKIDELMKDAFEKILNRDWADKTFVERIASGVIESISRSR